MATGGAEYEAEGAGMPDMEGGMPSLRTNALAPFLPQFRGQLLWRCFLVCVCDQLFTPPGRPEPQAQGQGGRAANLPPAEALPYRDEGLSAATY